MGEIQIHFDRRLVKLVSVNLMCKMDPAYYNHAIKRQRGKLENKLAA